ncbi:MAG: NUDIX hydrolase [Lactobacillales bacterium]|jgi:ADP-ribose pyrophosphatase YjhB (NUDIX family)|nr:NUDIX hydrolase [Lactobacillales bacterium]
MLKNKFYYEQQASQEEFLEWYQTQNQPNYEKPSVTVDLVIFNPTKDKILLIQRKANPFREAWALPGGFINPQEASETAVLRETFEETSIKVSEKDVKQLYTFSTPFRDPRGWVISIAYTAILPVEPVAVAGDDARNAEWFPIREQASKLSIGENILLDLITGDSIGTDSLAFDHVEIILKAWENVSHEKC